MLLLCLTVSGSRDEMRLVSRTSVGGKLLEKILWNRIYSDLEANGLIRDSQHGFVHGRPCLVNVIELFEVIMKVIDESRAIDIGLMKLSKSLMAG